MATINSTTLQACARTMFYRLNLRGIPIRLPFELITIDADFQAYEPQSFFRVTPEGRTSDGALTDAVYLTNNRALPDGTTPVFSYFGL